MGISNTRTVEARRNSDGFHFATLSTPFDEELADGNTLSVTFRHDGGERDNILFREEEAKLLFEALDDWIYGA
jgi:hypothetical protein